MWKYHLAFYCDGSVFFKWERPRTLYGDLKLAVAHDDGGVSCMKTTVRKGAITMVLILY